jgi:hypothetical protein
MRFVKVETEAIEQFWWVEFGELVAVKNPPHMGAVFEVGRRCVSGRPGCFAGRERFEVAKRPTIHPRQARNFVCGQLFRQGGLFLIG